MTAPDARASSPYFVNPPVDLLFAGGASLAIFAILYLCHAVDRSPWVYQSAAWLVWIAVWPHFSATNYSLYSSRASRRRYPLTAWLIPPIMAATVAGCVLSPLRWAPFFVKVLSIWTPYHYAGQTLGITLLYAHRSGIWVRTWQRNLMSLLIFSVFFSQTIAAETGIADRQYFGIHYGTLNLPSWVVEASRVVMYSALVGAAVVFWSWWKSSKRVPALILAIPVLAQFVWSIVASNRPAFLEFVPFFHSLQYLLVAWAAQMRGRPGGYVLFRASARWGIINFFGGACLFYLLPKLLAAGVGTSPAFSIGAVIAAVQIHHFIVDGVIWKLRSQNVAQSLTEALAEPSRAVASPEPWSA